jgi:hypothetical protein
MKNEFLIEFVISATNQKTNVPTTMAIFLLHQKKLKYVAWSSVSGNNWVSGADKDWISQNHSYRGSQSIKLCQ